MNCANHPERPATSYCQQCGKPMCSECARPVANTIHCEQCLAGRLGVGLPGQAPPFFPPGTPNPALAGLLGIIPGVGAMYNGQFIKALVHVLIFAVLVSLSHADGVFGLFVAAWVFYQIFDAYQTARARRDGLPLPNPFGLNDLGPHMGFTAPYPPAAPPASATAGGAASSAGGNVPGGAAGPEGAANAAEFGTAAASPGSASSYYAAPNAAQPFAPPPPMPAGSRAPIGAIVLIAVGIFLLLETLGLVHAFWVGRLWPLLFIVLGVWLAVRDRSTPRGGI